MSPKQFQERSSALTSCSIGQILVCSGGKVMFCRSTRTACYFLSKFHCISWWPFFA